MRYDKGRKDQTRRHILEVAGKRFRESGIEAVGVAALMADAGLTHGGFYSHFESKEDLVREALTEALQGTKTVLAEALREGGLAAMVHVYLHPTHRDNPGHGCALAALTAELARRPDETRATLSNGLQEIAELIAERLPGDEPKVRLDTAMAIFGTLLGALQLARGVTDPVMSDGILESGAQAALVLASGCAHD